MTPAVVLLTLIVLVPLGFAAWISFLELDQYSLRQWLDAPWVGMANYVEAISKSTLAHSLWISVAFSLLTTALAAPIGLMAALSLNARFRGRGLARSVFLVPYVIPTFVTATMWRMVLQPSGAVNNVLGDLGLGGNTTWLIGDMSFWTLVLVDVWASWAFIYLMTLAGLQTVPNELYEAADVDGIRWWQKIWYVVLPQVRGPLTLGLLLSTLHHFNNFTLPFVLFGSPAPEAVNVLPVNIFETSFHVFRFGLGAAMAIASLAVLAIPAVVYLRSVRLDGRPGEEDA
ncbi:MAG: carbohydrate ABC transporter permease [Streptomyces sp.]|uniref:carbohydrate ABC transporter permease n=1 Tax=Streptomyces sp. TaxID=1931 RepID=UPI003D6C2236